MFGTILLYATLIFFLLGFISQLLSKKVSLLDKIYDKLYYAGFGTIIIASGVHLLNLISHDFRYAYVAHYSSRSLAFYLNLSSFFAGQEGSFLFWTLCAVVIGFPLVKNSKKNDLTKTALAFYAINLIFLSFALIFKSPFKFLWEVSDVAVGFVPKDGNGLNPILENFWMAIHPPILFIGFALAAIPYSFALAGLIKKDYDTWIITAKNWILSGSLFLGIGLALGGVWAYETLGWGGFWGWDPVENSSLIPWLFIVALTHTIIIQRKTGGLRITNVVLAILTFVTTVYSTFLTRSGVLSDFSVHSFPPSEKVTFYIILSFLALFLVLGVSLLLFRAKDMKTKISFEVFSKEYFFTLGISLLAAYSMLIIVGISLPLIGQLFSSRQELLEPSYYELIGSPVAFVFLIFAALSFVVSWKERKLLYVNKYYLIAFAAISLILTLITKISLIHSPIIFASFFACFLILTVLIKTYAKSRHKLGSYMSHIGLSIMLLGVSYHGLYKEAFPVALSMGDSGVFAGKQLKFIGKERIEANLKDREKYNYIFELGDNKEHFKPVVYWSNFNRMQTPFFEPAVKTEMGVDYYLSPKSIDYKQIEGSLELTKGVSGILNDSISVEFLGYDMNQGHSEVMALGAIVKITINGKSQEKGLVYYFPDEDGRKYMPQWTEIDGSNLSIGFTNFTVNRENMGESKIELGLAKERISFDFERKPAIPIVWVGLAFILGGFLVAMTSRKKN